MRQECHTTGRRLKSTLGAFVSPTLKFTLSVNALVRDRRGRYLLLRRSPLSRVNPGKWDLPGGKVYPGEGFDQALFREVAEETGLEISLERLAAATEAGLDGRRVIHIIMEARFVSGRLRLSHEHDAFAWVSREELGSVDACPQFRAFLRAFATDKA